MWGHVITRGLSHKNYTMEILVRGIVWTKRIFLVILYKIKLACPSSGNIFCHPAMKSSSPAIFQSELVICPPVVLFTISVSPSLSQVLQLRGVCSRRSAGLQQLRAIQRGHIGGGNGWTRHEALLWEPLGGVLLKQGQIGPSEVPPNDDGALCCWCCHRPGHTLSITAKTVWRIFQLSVLSHV